MSLCIYCWDELPIESDEPAWHDACESLFLASPGPGQPASVETIISAESALKTWRIRKPDTHPG